MSQAMFALEPRSPALQMISEVMQDTLGVIGMDALTPLVDAIGDLMVGVPEEALPSFGKIDPIRPQVPLPHRVVRTSDRKPVPFFQSSQVGLDSKALSRLLGSSVLGVFQQLPIAGKAGGNSLKWATTRNGSWMPGRKSGWTETGSEASDLAPQCRLAHDEGYGEQSEQRRE